MDILAGTDIDIIGNNVGILAAKNIYDRKDIYKTKTSGLTLALKGGVVSALEAAWQAAQRAHGAEDDRLQAAYALKAGYNIYNAVLKDNGAALTHLVEGDILSSATNVGIELSLGTQSSESVNTQHNVTYRASNLDATGDLTVIARAPEAGQTGGVIDIMGSNLKGYNQTLSAGKLLSVRYAPQTYASRETGKSESASVGVGISVGDQNGIYFTAGGQWGNSQGYAYREDNGESYLTAENTLALLSGGDATIKGAIASANRIEADIAGNLTLTSLQDTDRYTYKNQNVGFGISVCVPPICYGTPVNASISASGQNLDHNYQSVVEQTGLFAGEGGFDIQVGGHTQLDGAAIVSSATADKNRLITQTLDYTDLTNTEKTKVSGYSFGLGTTVASNYFTPTPGVNDNRSSVTQSLVSPGTVEVRSLSPAAGVQLQTLSQSQQNQLASVNAELLALQPQKAAADAALNQNRYVAGVFCVYNCTYTAMVARLNEWLYNPQWANSPFRAWGIANATNYINAVKPLIAAELSIVDQYSQLKTQADGFAADLAIIQAQLGKHLVSSTLQSRQLATANPALNNTFNANRTRAQLEAMNIFSETAMRIVGDVYKNDVATSDLKLKAASDKLKASASGSAAETTAKAELTAAQAERDVLDNKRAVAHGLVGGLTAALGGADPVSGAIGATAGKLVTTELDELLANNQWAKDNPYAANLLKTLSATAAGSLIGGSTGGFVASQGDRFNRQLHWTKYVSKKLACTGEAATSTECVALNKMAGTRQQVLSDGFAGLAESKIIANYDEQDRIVSFTITDNLGVPQLIMEPLEFEVYRSLPQNGRAQYLTSAQYELDTASYLLYAAAGNSARAFEHLRYAYADPELWKNVATDAALGGLIGKTASLIGKTQLINKLGWALNRFKQSDLPPGYLLAQDGRVLKDGRYVGEREAAKATNWKLADGRDWYPGNNGVVGTAKPQTLQKGAIIDRYGDNDTAQYFSPPGTPFGARSLPSSQEARPLVQYEVLKPLPVETGKIAAWFGQPGGGTQFKTAMKLSELVANGYLGKLP